MSSLSDRIASGHLDHLLIGARENRTALVREHGPVLRDALVFDPYRTTIHGYTDDEMERLLREDEGWLSTGSADALGNLIKNWSELWRYLAAIYHRDPIAKNIINAYSTFTVGRGFSVTFEAEEVQTQFEEWADRTGFWTYVRRMVTTTFLFGSCFTIRYPVRRVSVSDLKTSRGAATNGTDSIRKTGSTILPGKAEAYRLWEPTKVQDILFDPDDVETEIGYVLAGKQDVAYPPEYAIHHRLSGAGTVARGIPILLPAIVDLKRLDKFSEDRYWVNRTRARIPLIRRLEGSAGELKTIADKPTAKVIPPPGTVYYETANLKWEFPQHNIGASDVRDDWRMLMLRVAAAVSLPEYLVSMDASNSNYASTLVAESPAHLMFTAIQEEFIVQIDHLLEWFFPGQARVIDPSPIIPRDFSGEATAWGGLVEKRIVSKETARAKLGLDPATEAERVSAEREEEIALLPPAPPTAPGGTPLAPRFGFAGPKPA